MLEAKMDEALESSSQVTDTCIDSYKDNILLGDSWQLSKRLPTGSANCIVTSPPYFGHREYSDSDEIQQYEIGHESNPEDYVHKLISLFEELHRVLDPKGRFWL